MNLLVLLAHYHNSAEVGRFLEELRRLAVPGDRVLVYLCDNSGELGDADTKQGLEHSDTEVFKVYIRHYTRNLGYLGGCAAAWDAFEASGDAFTPDWIIVSNTDIRFGDDFLERLRSLKYPQDAGVLAPSILRSDGTDHNPYKHRAPSTRHLRLLWRLLAFPSLYTMYHHLARRWYRLRARRQSPPSAQAIFAPHGSLMLLHPQFFALGGTLASEVFMYHEEWYIGAQCRRLGLKVWYEPVVKAFHHEATSTGAIPMAQRCRWKREAIEMILRGL